jgi:hypothetical protein
MLRGPMKLDDWIAQTLNAVVTAIVLEDTGQPPDRLRGIKIHETIYTSIPSQEAAYTPSSRMARLRRFLKTKTG